MYRIGIDLGGTNIVAGLVDRQYRIVDKVSVKTNVPRSVESIVGDMARMAVQLVEQNRLTWEQIASVGVGVPCTANPENGHMEDANNLGFDDVPFLTLLVRNKTFIEGHYDTGFVEGFLQELSSGRTTETEESK